MHLNNFKLPSSEVTNIPTKIEFFTHVHVINHNDLDNVVQFPKQLGSLGHLYTISKNTV